MRRAGFSVLTSLILMSACATPALNYQAELPPGRPEVAEHRHVAVSQFAGPLGDWYRAQFRLMLENADFNGAPWFEVDLEADANRTAAVYYGTVELFGPTVFETFQTASECTFFDVDNSCLRQRSFEVVCTHYEVRAVVRPQLVDRQSGLQVFTEQYEGEALHRECQEVSFAGLRQAASAAALEKAGLEVSRRDYEQPNYQPNAGKLIDMLAVEALRETLVTARRDVAPYNRKESARLSARAILPEVAEDRRFQRAMKAARRQDHAAACALFEEIAADHEGAPAVMHNLGACAEAGGDGARAVKFYSDAVNLAETQLESPPRHMVTSFKRASEQARAKDELADITPRTTRAKTTGSP